MQIAATSPLPPVPASGAGQARPDAARASESQAGENRQPSGQEAQQGERAADRGPLELTEAEQAQVRELQQRDREVRAHELAHVAAGGRYVTKPAAYQYQIGPDGRRYAVGGEVTIDTSVPADPQEALAKAQIIERAALAPVDPSQQDYRVAAKARQMAAEARQEIAAERLAQNRNDSEPGRPEIRSETSAETSPESNSESEPGPAPARLPLATAEALAPSSRLSLFA